MGNLLRLVRSLGSAGALHNARAELELEQSRRVQAALLACRIGAVDASAARRDVATLSQPAIARRAA